MPLLWIRQELLNEVKFSFANKKDNNTHHKKKKKPAGFVPSVEFVMASSVAFK